MRHAIGLGAALLVVSASFGREEPWSMPPATKMVTYDGTEDRVNALVLDGSVCVVAVGTTVDDEPITQIRAMRRTDDGWSDPKVVADLPADSFVVNLDASDGTVVAVAFYPEDLRLVHLVDIATGTTSPLPVPEAVRVLTAAIEGDVIVLTGSNVTTKIGAAWSYQRVNGEWRFEGYLPNPDDRGRHGLSISLSTTDRGEPRVLLGAPGPQESAGGAAMLLERSSAGWSLVHTFEPPVHDAAYGIDVSVQGDRAIVASPGHDEVRGIVHVFERRWNGEWVTDARLMSPDALPSRRFAWSVEQHDCRVIVGTRSDTDLLSDDTDTVALVFRKDRGRWASIEGYEVGTLSSFAAVAISESGIAVSNRAFGRFVALWDVGACVERSAEERAAGRDPMRHWRVR